MGDYRKPTDDEVEAALSRMSAGKVRRCIPVQPTDDDVVISDAIASLRTEVERLTKERDEARDCALQIAGAAARGAMEERDQAIAERDSARAECAFVAGERDASRIECARVTVERDRLAASTVREGAAAHRAEAECARLREALGSLAAQIEVSTRMFHRFGETGEQARDTNARDRARAEVAKEIRAALARSPEVKP